MQKAVTAESLPKHVNQTVYASMIAGVSALAQINVVNLQYGYTQRLRSLFAKITRTFLQARAAARLR